MLNDDVILHKLGSGDVQGVHALLDAAMPGETAEEKHSIAYWRTATLIREKRFEEALIHLQQNKLDFGCKTFVHHEAARILDHLGRDHEAIAALATAPFADETEKYRLLVKEAKFHLMHLRARNGINVDASDMAEIPDDYIAVLPSRQHPFGQHVSKADLKAMVGVIRGE